MDLEQHFQKVDSVKKILFNANTDEQEKTARRLMTVVKDEENQIYVKGVEKDEC